MRVYLGISADGKHQFIAVDQRIFVDDAIELIDERVNPVLNVAKKRGRPRKDAKKHASGNSTSAPETQTQNA